MRCTIGNQDDMVGVKSARWLRRRARDALASASGRSSRKPRLPGSYPALSLDPSLRAFGNQRALQLGDSAQNLQRKHALWRRGSKVRAHLLQVLDHLHQMVDRPCQPISPHHDQHIVRFNPAAASPAQVGPGTRRSPAPRKLCDNQRLSVR
jgi:hypothetical protein